MDRQRWTRPQAFRDAFATANKGQILPKALEERVPHLAFGGSGAILDFGRELWLHPDALVRDPFGVGLRLADQRRQALAQIGCGCLVETMITFPA